MQILSRAKALQNKKFKPEEASTKKVDVLFTHSIEVAKDVRIIANSNKNDMAF
jgi:hypothetical protein